MKKIFLVILFLCLVIVAPSIGIAVNLYVENQDLKDALENSSSNYVTSNTNYEFLFDECYDELMALNEDYETLKQEHESLKEEYNALVSEITMVEIEEALFGDDSESTEDISYGRLATIYEGSEVIIKISEERMDDKGNAHYKIVCENHSIYDYNFAVFSFAVNGKVTHAETDIDTCVDVVSGSKGTIYLTIDSSVRKDLSIGKAKYVDLILWITEVESFEKSFFIPQLTHMYTSDTRLMPSYRDNIIYESNDITITKREVNDNSFCFSVYNKTGEFITISISTISVDGWAFDPSIQVYQLTIPNNCTGVYTVDVDQEFLKENSIDKISKVEMRLNINPEWSFENEYQTDVITIQK